MAATPSLLPCPFCAYEKPPLATIGNDQVQFFVAVCPECGAVGPRATNVDPRSHAEPLWNQRFGPTQ
jgi:hypothetical protein